MYGIGYAIIAVVISAIAGLIALALYMFISIVRHTPHLKQDLNFTPIVFQIIGLVAWTATWLGEGALFLMYYRSQTYKVYRNVVIIDAVSFIMNLDIFMIVAYVLFKSSRAVGLKHDPELNQDVSLLAYMRN